MLAPDEMEYNYNRDYLVWKSFAAIGNPFLALWNLRILDLPMNDESLAISW